jgi:hypothetical protein
MGITTRDLRARGVTPELVVQLSVRWSSAHTAQECAAPTPTRQPYGRVIRGNPTNYWNRRRAAAAASRYRALVITRTGGPFDDRKPRIEFAAISRPKPDVEVHVDPQTRFSVFDFGERVRRLVIWLHSHGERSDELFSAFVNQLLRDVTTAKVAR